MSSKVQRERDDFQMELLKLVYMYMYMQCYAVDGATKSRQSVGYVMLDLRTAHPKSQQVH